MGELADFYLALEAITELERLRRNIRANANGYLQEIQAPIRPLSFLLSDIGEDAKQFRKRLIRVYNSYSDLTRRPALVSGLIALNIQDTKLVATCNEIQTAIDSIINSAIITKEDVLFYVNNLLSILPEHDSILEREL